MPLAPARGLQVLILSRDREAAAGKIIHDQLGDCAPALVSVSGHGFSRAVRRSGPGFRRPRIPDPDLGAEQLKSCADTQRARIYAAPYNVGLRAGYLIAIIAIVILAVFPAFARAAQPKTSLEKVGRQVYCLCGCVTTLNHCPHLPSQCQSRAEMTGVILTDIRQGNAEPGILQDLARRYGVQVLAAPPAKGFDLAAWVLPGFGLVIGLVAVVLIVRHLRAKPPARPPEGELPIDADVMAAVEEEMQRTVPGDQ